MVSYRDVVQYALLFLAALLAGAINSVAGGGTLLTFPALLAIGVPWVAANATSTVALVPGSLSGFLGYRSEMEGSRGDLLRMGLPSVVGGLLGAVFVVKAGDTLFSHLVPWLIFSATALFIIQEPVRRWLAKRSAAGSGERGVTWGAMVFQFFVALYGGFFGAGIGILMLAALGLMGQRNIHRMNGLKNFAAICINGVAAITFIALHRVHWAPAGVMAVAAILGGYAGAGLAQRVGQANVRRFVIFIGLSIGLYTLLHRL
jgi:uncharacterized membrane protein YfcA